MTHEKKYIGFDIGAESGRCIVAVLKDKTINLHEVHRFTSHNMNYFEGFHWDILAIFEEMVIGLKKAKQEFGSTFDGISVDTWGVDYVLLDPDNRILGYPYHYRDDRTDGMIDKAFGIIPREDLYMKSGIQFAQYNTQFQLMAEQENELNLLSIADTMLLMPDFLLFLLSGVKKAEYSIASTTGLTDPAVRDWSDELIQKFGFPKNIFPEIVEPGTKLGTLLPEIAKRTGLSANIPAISSAGHDTASAVVSVPAKDGSWAFLSSGTWSLLGLELDKPLISIEALRCNFTNEGGMARKTRFLKNIIGLWPIQECRRFWEEEGKKYSYSELTAMAKESKESTAWIDLDDARFLKAGDMPAKIFNFLKETGQTIDNTVGQIIRCVVESLAFSYRKTFRELEQVVGREIKFLHMVGGGINNDLLNQLTADALDREVIAGPVEGTVIGNVGVQAIATGSVANLQEWRNIVRNSFELQTYAPKNREYFNSHENKYNQIINAQ